MYYNTHTLECTVRRLILGMMSSSDMDASMPDTVDDDDNDDDPVVQQPDTLEYDSLMSNHDSITEIHSTDDIVNNNNHDDSGNILLSTLSILIITSISSEA